MPRLWTAEELRTALALRKEGLSFSEIGSSLGGRSESSVRHALGRSSGDESHSTPRSSGGFPERAPNGDTTNSKSKTGNRENPRETGLQPVASPVTLDPKVTLTPLAKGVRATNEVVIRDPKNKDTYQDKGSTASAASPSDAIPPTADTPQPVPASPVLVDALFSPEKNGEAVWAEAERRNRSKIEWRKHCREVFADMGPLPVAISFISDQHILEGGLTDLQRMREDAELIASSPGLFAVLGGDGIENHIKHRSAIINTNGTAGSQYRLYDHYLNTINPLLVISGNHDHWTKQFVGVDMVDELCRSQRFVYRPHGARLNLLVGSIHYRIEIRHQYRFNSSFNLTHTVKRLLEKCDDEFDIGVVGHHHQAALENYTYRGRRRVLIRPGTYKVADDHSDQYGYTADMQTCPTVILDPDRYSPVGFDSVRDAAPYLEHLRWRKQNSNLSPPDDPAPLPNGPNGKPTSNES